MLEENFPAFLLNKLHVTWHFHYFITICTTDSKVLTVKEHPSLELASHFYGFGFYQMVGNSCHKCTMHKGLPAGICSYSLN